MSDTDKEPFNGIFMELTTTEEGQLMFSAGYDFDDEVLPEYVEYMKDVLAGVLGYISMDIDKLVEAGQLMRANPAFDQTIENANRPEKLGDNVYVFPTAGGKH